LSSLSYSRTLVRQVVKQALGTSRGQHKACGVQTAVLNLDANERFEEKEILLPVLAKAKVYKKHGMARVLCGVDADGVQHDEPNYARDLRRLDEGVWCEIPDDVNGGMKPVRIKAWDLMFAGDMLGCNSVLPFCETTGAYLFCRACDYDRSSADAGRPFSFLRQAPPRTASNSTPDKMGKRQKTFEPPRLRVWKVRQPHLLLSYVCALIHT
jgi:hypothetical protein